MRLLLALGICSTIFLSNFALAADDAEALATEDITKRTYELLTQDEDMSDYISFDNQNSSKVKVHAKTVDTKEHLSNLLDIENVGTLYSTYIIDCVHNEVSIKQHIIYDKSDKYVTSKLVDEPMRYAGRESFINKYIIKSCQNYFRTVELNSKPSQHSIRFSVSAKTVVDKHSGLTWARNANINKSDWNGSNRFIKEINKKKYAGYVDWRLPNEQELMTLVGFVKGTMNISGYFSHDEVFKKMGFDKVQAGEYWTSNISKDFPKDVWMMLMPFGYVRSSSKGQNNNVWLVRGTSSPRSVSSK